MMLRLVGLTLLIATIAAPAAAAHTTVSTSDGKFLITVGNLNEPVSTFTKTGLDLIIRTNETVRQPVTGVQLTLNATLMAPNGKTLSQPLEARFGAPGSYTFEEMYYLSMPGEYFLAVDGTINGTAVDIPKILVGSGPIPDYDGLTFPDDVDSPKQMQDRIAKLEAEIQSLKAASGDNGGTAAGVDTLGILAVLGFAGAMVARRKT